MTTPTLPTPQPTVESLLLTRILFHHDEYGHLKRQDFVPDMLGPAYVAAFKEIERYRVAHGELPGAPHLLRAAPGIQIQREDPSRPASVYWEGIRNHRWRQSLLLTMEHLATKATNVDGRTIDPLKDLTLEANRQFANIAATFMSDEDSAKTGNEIAHELVEEMEGPEEQQGIPIPFEFLQEEIRGFKPGQMYIIAGRPKSGKTWLALICAAHALKMKNRVLITSLEMRKREILRRLACIIGRVSFNRVMKRKLSAEEKAKYYQVIDGLRGEYGAKLLVAGPGSAKTPEAVDAISRNHGADLVVVDSFYKMDAPGEKDWERTQSLVRRFSRLTLMSKAPWLLVTQFNRGGRGRGGAHLGNLAFSDAIGQDANAMIYVVRNNFLKKANQVDLILGEAREADDRVAFRHRWDFKEMRWDPVSVVDYGSDDQEV